MDKKDQIKRELERTREFNYTDSQRVQMLRDIQDNALDWAADLVRARKSTGSGAAIHMYEQAFQHANALENKTKAANSSINIPIPGFDASNVVMPESQVQA